MIADRNQKHDTTIANCFLFHSPAEFSVCCNKLITLTWIEIIQVRNHYICISFFQYTVLFRVGTVHSVSQAIEATPLDSSESSFDTYRSPPRPLPYDDPRFSPPLRDWFASRHDPSSHSPEESEPLRPNYDEEMETMSSVDKPSKTNYDTKMKRSSSAYGDKLSRKESGNYFTYFSPSTEDEDVCPTCLEGNAH